MKVKLFAAFAALALAAGIAQAQTKLKFAHVYEVSEPYHTAALWAAGEIAKRTNNRYQIEVFPASTLGKETDINQGLTLGTVDIIYTGQLFAGRTYGPIAIGGAPYMFRDFNHWKAFSTSALFAELADGYQKKSGNKVVAITYYGERHVTSNKPINKPEDMKGLKIRVPDAPLYTMFPRAVGANPTPIAFAEVYLALQNGTVDAQENPLPTIDAKKFYEVQKYIVLTGHITDALITIIGGPTWNKLSDADRKIFEAVLKEAAARATNEIIEIEKKLGAEFEKRGKSVVRVDRAPFRAAVVKLHNGPDATWDKATYDKLQALK
ncbi:DctP family TRAP transporter solute-binding subunit [Betaproteobacteria bacterium PRO7]|jgi:tripartite ATP-independent transporter DctP family solute receptor|nr:sialic acid TRAP transporter substrate-binding protein SiaP [Burkholderiaceae bacterium]MDL1859503.1 DctP family TRAP transporter solute-binding subunit [Betaproteobacteria bacterium PRO7]GIL04896.1 MAG: ABC transporter substrate-binding protein [Betaproteobacteria bacterium]